MEMLSKQNVNTNLKVLYVVGSCLTNNTSANMSHNAYIQGLLENNCDVDIIMASDSWGQKDSALPRWRSANYFEYDSLSMLNKIRNHISRNFLPVQTADSTTSNCNQQRGEKNIKKTFRGLLKKIYYLFFSSDPLYPLERTWLRKASKFKSHKNYDLVISNSSPAASHKLVIKLVEKHHIFYKRWIQLWEDPWYFDLYGGHSEKVKEEEHFLLRKANEIYYVSPLTLKYQQEYYEDCAKKMKYIPLPYLDFSKGNGNSAATEISFGYFGDYYSKTRNLLPFYQALCETGAKGYIYGDSDLALNKTEKIDVSARVTLDKLAKIQNQVGVLVHLCNLRGGQIPGKIYHYSATHKPILFILDGTLEEQQIIRKYFEKYQRYIFCSNDTESIKSAITDISENIHSYTEGPVEEFSPKQVIKNLFGIIDFQANVPFNF